MKELLITYERDKDGKMVELERKEIEIPHLKLSPLDKLVTILCEKGVITITEAESIERNTD